MVKISIATKSFAALVTVYEIQVAAHTFKQSGGMVPLAFIQTHSQTWQVCFHNSTLAPRSERSSAKGRSTWKASGLKLEVDFTEKSLRLVESLVIIRDIHCVYASINLVPLCRAERPKPLATTPSSSSLTTSAGAWKSPRHTPAWWLGCGMMWVWS